MVSVLAQIDGIGFKHLKFGAFQLRTQDPAETIYLLSPPQGFEPRTHYLIGVGYPELPAPYTGCLVTSQERLRQLAVAARYQYDIDEEIILYWINKAGEAEIVEL